MTVQLAELPAGTLGGTRLAGVGTLLGEALRQNHTRQGFPKNCLL
jgi:hypothetical protein